MDILTHQRAETIVGLCKNRGVELSTIENHDPIDFISIINKREDMVSVSENNIVYEPALYAAPWSQELIDWATNEGFPEDVIESQSLIRSVSLEEAVDYLCA